MARSYGASGNPPGVRQSANPQALRARRIQALELRIQGRTLDQIGRILHITMRTVSADIRAILDERAVQATEEGRAMERERLEALHVRAWSILQQDGLDPELALKVLDRLVRIAERRSKLEGYDSPVRVDATVHEVTQQDLELQQLLREAQAHTTAAHEAVRAPEPEAPTGE